MRYVDRSLFLLSFSSGHSSQLTFVATTIRLVIGLDSFILFVGMIASKSSIIDPTLNYIFSRLQLTALFHDLGVEALGTKWMILRPS